MEKLYGKQLEIMATKARLLGLDAVHTAASGHIGGSLSAMDILTTLYFNVMQVDPANPQDPDRDALCCPRATARRLCTRCCPCAASSRRRI